MEVRTTEPYSPQQNKSESVIKIIKVKANRIIVHSNIPKRFWDFGMVWEAEIYSHTLIKDGRPDLERLTGDTIYISEWLEFELCDLVWFWYNKSDYTKPMFGQRMVVSHRFVSALCHSILSGKVKVLSLTTFQHLTAE